MPSIDDKRAALEKDATILRDLIRHENELTNHRVTWLLVSQGILFTAAAVFVKIHWFPAVVLGVVGIAFAVSIGQSLQNSFEARQYIKGKWRESLRAAGFEWEEFPPLDGGVPGVRAINWLFPWIAVPRVIMIAWFLLICFFLWGRHAA
jgi:hypothetical protein